MKNDTRINVHHRCTALCLALSAAVFAAPVMADVALPPPAQHQNAGFPSDQALQRRGYDPKTGVWKVDVQNNGKPTVTKNGGNINGSQGKNVTVTGRYGETGTMNTTVSQNVNVGKVETILGGTLAGATAAGGAIGSDYAAWTYRDIKEGDWAGAARNGVGAVLTGLSKLDITGLGAGINSFLDKTGLRTGASSEQISNEIQKAAQAQHQAEAEGNYQKAVAEAAAKKAAEAAQKAQQKDQQKREEQKRDEEAKKQGLYKYQAIFNVNGVYSNQVFYYPGSGLHNKTFILNNRNKDSDWSRKFEGTINVFIDDKAVPPSLKLTGLPTNQYAFPKVSFYREGEVPESEKQKLPQNQSQVKPEDFMLTQKEMLDILKRMLENNETNHAELMNQLAKMGVMNQSAEKSTFSPDTALSAPYTPQGSSTPQQTRFKMNQDGTVGVDYVPRPDLKPNSPDAPNKPEKTTPSRQESPDTPNSPNTPNQPNNPSGQQNQNQENQKQDFCKQNPNTAQCMPSGESSYQDIKLPEQTIDLNFRPENIFQTNGVCPQPQSVDLGAFGRVEFSYQTLCDFAAKLRPVLIMMTILTCSWFVYGALQDL